MVDLVIKKNGRHYHRTTIRLSSNIDDVGIFAPRLEAVLQGLIVKLLDEIEIEVLLIGFECGLELVIEEVEG